VRYEHINFANTNNPLNVGAVLRAATHRRSQPNNTNFCTDRVLQTEECGVRYAIHASPRHQGRLLHEMAERFINGASYCGLAPIDVVLATDAALLAARKRCDAVSLDRWRLPKLVDSFAG